MSTLLIKHAQLPNRKTPADVLIRDGVINQVSQSITVSADSIIDATGLLLIPGMVDTHVHLRVPGEEYKEDFVTGSASALSGGVTTVCDMPNNKPPITTVAQLQEKIAQAKKEGAVDIRCFIGATKDNMDELKAAEGIAVGVKVAPYFTGVDGTKLIDDDASLEKLFAMRLKMPVVVHCEDERMVGEHSVKLRQYGGADIHSRLRSVDSAVTALKRIISIVKKTDSAVHITHVSSKRELSLITKAKKDRIRITCDVTPHHLTFTDRDVVSRGHTLKVNPPVRSEADVAALWDGLVSGTVDCVATDHAPHTWEEKTAESYWDVPSGLPGLDTALLLMLDRVDDEYFTLQRMIEVTSTMPAKLFGLSGLGSLNKGSTADLVLVNMHAPTVITRPYLHTKAQWSPWMGYLFRATIRTVIRGGAVAFERVEPTVDS